MQLHTTEITCPCEPTNEMPKSETTSNSSVSQGEKNVKQKAWYQRVEKIANISGFFLKF